MCWAGILSWGVLTLFIKVTKLSCIWHHMVESSSLNGPLLFEPLFESIFRSKNVQTKSKQNEICQIRNGKKQTAISTRETVCLRAKHFSTPSSRPYSEIPLHPPLFSSLPHTILAPLSLTNYDDWEGENWHYSPIPDSPPSCQTEGIKVVLDGERQKNVPHWGAVPD